MKRNLIDRTELFNRLATITAADPNEMKAKIYAVIQDMDGKPDGAGIVRCKECYMCDEEMWCSFYDSIMESDDFCSCGEREGE